MKLLSRVRFACLVVLGCGAFTLRSAAADPPASLVLRLPNFENPLNVIPVRKLARKVLQFGNPGDDEIPISIGPARARLLWHKKWKWHESTRDRKIPGGLLGGPVLSIDMPLTPINRLFSLETRFSSFRYTHAKQKTARTALDELADPQGQRQSLEAGLYLNMSFGGLF